MVRAPGALASTRRRAPRSAQFCRSYPPIGRSAYCYSAANKARAGSLAVFSWADAGPAQRAG